MISERKAAGVTCWREGGWYVPLDFVLPALSRRFGVATDVEVFLHAYRMKFPGVSPGRRQIRVDLDNFLNGGHAPDYVMWAYTQPAKSPLAIAAE